MNTRKPTPPAQRALCLILAFLLSCSLFATGCAPQVNTPETQAPTEAPIPETTQTPTEKPAAEEYTLPLEDGYNQLTFYWNSPAGYENCDMWIMFASTLTAEVLFFAISRVFPPSLLMYRLASPDFRSTKDSRPSILANRSWS